MRRTDSEGHATGLQAERGDVLVRFARWFALLVFLLLSIRPTLSQRSIPPYQRTIEPRILGGLQLMGQWPNLAGSTGGAAAFPFLGLGFDLGGSFTYRDRLGLALQGSLVGQGYYRCAGGDCLDLYHLTQRFEARAWWVLHGTELDGNFLRVGLGWGLSLQNHNEGNSEKGASNFHFFEP